MWFVTKKLLYLKTNFSLQFLFLLSGKVSEHSNNLVDFQSEKTNKILNNVETHSMEHIDKSNLEHVEGRLK